MPVSTTFARLLSEHFAILAPTANSDAYGNESFDYPDASTVLPVRGRIEQTQSTEITTGRDTQVSDWRLFLLPGVEITGDSRVVRMLTGDVFEVVGPPNIVTTPTQGAHHIEARLITYNGTQ